MPPHAARCTGAALLVTLARIVAAKHVRATTLQHFATPLRLPTLEALRLAALLNSCSTHSAEKVQGVVRAHAAQRTGAAFLATLAAGIVAAKHVRAASLRRLAAPLLLTLLWMQSQLQPSKASAEPATGPRQQGRASSAAGPAGLAAAGSASALQPAARHTLQTTIRGIIVEALRWIT